MITLYSKENTTGKKLKCTKEILSRVTKAFRVSGYLA